MHKFLPLAPSSEASRETMRQEGFKNAETVAKLLVSEQLQHEARGAVWLVDEAGMSRPAKPNGYSSWRRS